MKKRIKFFYLFFFSQGFFTIESFKNHLSVTNNINPIIYFFINEWHIKNPFFQIHYNKKENKLNYISGI